MNIIYLMPTIDLSREVFLSAIRTFFLRLSRKSVDTSYVIVIRIYWVIILHDLMYGNEGGSIARHPTSSTSLLVNSWVEK